jgi:hypothetical protein
MIFRPEGLMGSKELSIKKLLSRTKSGKGESLNA